MHPFQERGGQPGPHPLHQQKIRALQSLFRLRAPLSILCNPPAGTIPPYSSIILQLVQHLLHDAETADYICHEDNLAHFLSRLATVRIILTSNNNLSGRIFYIRVLITFFLSASYAADIRNTEYPAMLS